ncbi:MAG: aspartate aminotransferase family protein [Candidatus Acidiferrales bacterium]|jgi:acetylornithine aminotransferase/acetylornithine/N-succinyldiaminopimelate aminotransferase
MASQKHRAAPRTSPAKIIADGTRYLMNTYRRPPVVFTHGRGCRLYDSQGRAYLDFLAGIAVNALGYAHPRMVRVIRREAGRATHISNLFHNRYQGPLARKLAGWSGLDRVFFSNSGSEAMEGALKLARAHAHAKTAAPGGAPQTRILALDNSFHGRTFGALSITHTAKYREPFEPLVPGVEFVHVNDVADLESKFDESVCAIVIEPIQGEGGIFPIGEAFWQRARALATQYGAALIADEIQSGLGRTGRYFAYQKFGESALPDIVTIAKPLAGGLPLGACIANEQFASAFSPGMHGSTFGGGPLACAAALEFLNTVEEDGLLANVRDRGAELRAGIERLATRFDFIREVRGEGLILGIDLSTEGAPLVREALRRSLLINCTHDHILRLLPPFIIGRKDVAEFLRTFEAVLATAQKSAARANSAAHSPHAAARQEPLAAVAAR